MAAFGQVAVPERIRAAVYRGEGRIGIEEVPCPQVGPGELLVRVGVCGICNTDVKKITANLLAPPRIYGHETAGTIVAAGNGVTRFAPGDRVIVFHHVPCGHCFYCRERIYAQCPTYKKVGVTAGFEPAGGGFAEYTRVMDWIAERGVEKIPEGVTFEEASFVEPVNTCLKAVETAAIRRGERVLVMGQGPIGVLFLLLARMRGAQVFVSDVFGQRLERASKLGAEAIFNAQQADLPAAIRRLTEDRGADLAIVAAAVPSLIATALEVVRPGGRVLLFAQTDRAERAPLPAAAVCMEEKRLLGSYSADIDLQAESARLVFERVLPVRELITHHFPLAEIDQAVRLAAHPRPDSLKIIVHCA